MRIDRHRNYRQQGKRDIKQKTIVPDKQKNLEELCLVLPTRVEFKKGIEQIVKPCGVTHNRGDAVYCSKYADGTCDYLPKEKQLEYLESEKK